jgi:hypothetical protein
MVSTATHLVVDEQATAVSGDESMTVGPTH